MNTAYRELQTSNLFQGAFNHLAMTKHNILHFLLLGLLLFSAITVVYLKDEKRYLTSELEFLQQHENKLEVEWGQLLLEESTWATPSRVQNIAEQRFAMQVPSSEQTIMVR